MKNLLEYYYNIFPDKIYESNNVCYFFINDIKYYFVIFRRNVDDLSELVLLSNNLYCNYQFNDLTGPLEVYPYVFGLIAKRKQMYYYNYLNKLKDLFCYCHYIHINYLHKDLMI